METRLLIIGGGVTGTGLARDLALRGLPCVLVEQGDLGSGASGANHGLLHSGARYVSTDPQTAKECREEGRILKRLAPHCIEETGGLFVAVKGDDEDYISDFPNLCSESGIRVQEVNAKEAREMEPSLSDQTINAYMVPDATIDPFRLVLENMAHAQELGSTFLSHTKVTGLHVEDGRIRWARLLDVRTGKEDKVEPELVVSTAGAWSRKVAALAGLPLPMVYSKGSMLVTSSRITQRVVNRLHAPSDGDILVPGWTVSILGTTSVRMESLDRIYPTVPEIDLLVTEGATMLPELAATRYIRAYAGVRPLAGSGSQTRDQNVSRGFSLLDHQEDGINNFISVIGGKLTTYRLMAERTADLVCDHLGVSSPCLTGIVPLPSTIAGRWTTPGETARQWVEHHEPDDDILCACEMVSKSSIDAIADLIGDGENRLDLLAVGQRSRVGKGPCQGTFCALRIANYLSNKNHLDGEEILKALRAFQGERWKGQRPILWGKQIVPAELKEGIYCGFLGLEL